MERISDIPNVTMVFGLRNTLGLEPKILDEVKRGVKFLKEEKLIKFGTGIHKFNGFSGF